MDLKDLKSAWDTYSSQEEDKHRLGKENIHELLKIRTKTMVERFDRNIKIGMFVLGVYITYILLDIFSSVLIILTYLFFVLRYVRIKRSFSPDTQLKDFLSGIHNTLITYRRMFYLAVIILLINIILGFAAGLYQGIKIKTDLISGGIENLATSKILIITGVGLGILIPLVAFTFFILRWGFNKLYGRYLIKLNETLHELDESFGPK